MTKAIDVFLAAALTAGALQLLPAPASAADQPPSLGRQTAATASVDVGLRSGQPALQPPLSSSSEPSTEVAGARPPASASLAASCTPADFGSRTGSALVSFVKISTTDCIKTLLALTGTNAYNALREAQMVTIASALRDTSYPGDNSTSVEQLLLFLNAGYDVHEKRPSDVGAYGDTLKAANRSALDNFFTSAHSQDITDINGEILGEAVIQIDSSNDTARYLYVVRRLLLAFNGQYNASLNMRTAVNNVFTVLYHAHAEADFVAAVIADPSFVDEVYNFATRNLALLGTDSDFLVRNSGGETTRFVQHAALQAKVRPMAKSLLGMSSITGPSAPLWVRVAVVASYYDNANCTYYDVCDLVARLTAAALPITHNCDAEHTIRAQSLTSAALAAACASLISQDAFFHNIVKDSGPVANDHNTNIQIVNFATKKDYETYSGLIFGNATNNGGIYLEGNPAAVGNQARFISYIKFVGDGFPADIWNLNHEYTHYLDGRYDMYGDFAAGQVVPAIWWIEGFAEYVSYHYRGIADTEAIAEAMKHTYALSTLFQTTYANGNSARIYMWGYLAVRYMLEKHPADVQNMLAKFRVGDYAGGYAIYNTGIGTRYDADFDAWLTALTAGAAAANFTYAVNGPTASFTETSTGTVASRQWNFGDGTTSTATNPSHTYATAGTYAVTLTVTGSSGAATTKTSAVTVTVTSPGYPECTGTDVRMLGKNCKRSNLSANTGNLTYLYIYLPAGVTTLTITSTGGSGNADLYYNASTWAAPSSYTARSTNAGNTETITVNNPAAGYRFISLHATAAFSGVTVTTTY